MHGMHVMAGYICIVMMIVDDDDDFKDSEAE
jgi:heme/copper-type cytochrome/quinol oxidase subunit 3